MTDGIEGGREVAVTIVDQEAGPDLSLFELPGQVARLLDCPAVAWVLAAGGEDDASAGQLREEEDAQALEEHRVHREVVAARIARPWARRKRRQVSPARRGAGGMRWRRSKLGHRVSTTSIRNL